jgi:hypothetical protein
MTFGAFADNDFVRLLDTAPPEGGGGVSCVGEGVELSELLELIAVLIDSKPTGEMA